MTGAKGILLIDKRLSWSATLALRLLVCFLFQILYTYLESPFVVFAMVLVALVALTKLNLKSFLGVSVFYLLCFQTIWLFVSLFSYTSGLPPLQFGDVRWGIYTSDRVLLVSLISAQFLYILAVVGYKIPEGASFHFRPNSGLRLIALAIVFVTSFTINGSEFITNGGYTGNANSYWSGLPVFFIVALSAWILLQKSYGIKFVLISNAVIFYWLSTGNRSEVLMAFLIVNTITLFFSPFFRSWIPKWAIVPSLLFFGLIIFSVVGVVRSGGLDVSTSTNIPKFVQEDRIYISTVGSSVYSAVAAVSIAEENGFLYGESFVGQFINIVPSFIPVPWTRYEDVYGLYSDTHQTIGGYGLIGESYLNFSLFGSTLIPTMLAIVMRLLIVNCKKSFFSSWFLLSLFLYSQRLIFYGYVYLHNLVILFIIMGLIGALLKKSAGRKSNYAVGN